MDRALNRRRHGSPAIGSPHAAPVAREIEPLLDVFASEYSTVSADGDSGALTFGERNPLDLFDPEQLEPDEPDSSIFDRRLPPDEVAEGGFAGIAASTSDVRAQLTRGAEVNRVPPQGSRSRSDAKALTVLVAILLVATTGVIGITILRRVPLRPAADTPLPAEQTVQAPEGTTGATPETLAARRLPDNLAAEVPRSRTVPKVSAPKPPGAAVERPNRVVTPSAATERRLPREGSVAPRPALPAVPVYPPPVGLPKAPGPSPAESATARVATPAPTPIDATPSPRPALLPPVVLTAPPAAPAPSVPLTDAIQTLLGRYRTAFNGLDSNAAAAVWPTVDARTLGRAFNRLEEQTLEFDSCHIDVNDLRAVASCGGRLRYVPKVGNRSPQTEPRQWRFDLHKVNEEWLIAAVESR